MSEAPEEKRPWTPEETSEAVESAVGYAEVLKTPQGAIGIDVHRAPGGYEDT